jgi:spermidine/putrescine transport system permease protein
MVLPIYSSVEKLDKSYIEASFDLGANPVKTFFNVTFPLTLPGVVSGAILVFIPAMGLFFIPELMGGSKLMFIGNAIKNQFLTARDWPFGAALSIVLILLTLVLIGIYFRISKGNKEGIEVF